MDALRPAAARRGAPGGLSTGRGTDGEYTGPPPSSPLQPAGAEWTVMLYMDADCDLELYSVEDLNELMQVDSNERVNVIVLADRASSNKEEDGYSGEDVGGLKNWVGAKLLKVERGKLTVLQELGKTNMGDPATVEQFLRATLKQFPARRYAFIFQDHGIGWDGCCSDDSHKDDHLTLDEIDSGLKAGLQGQKLDLIAFDACVMGTLEVAATVAPYGSVMVASEENEPGEGFDLEGLIRRIHEDADMDAIEMGRTLVRAFEASYVQDKADVREIGVTMAAIDLEKVPPIVDAVTELAQAAQAELESQKRAAFLDLARASSGCERYGIAAADQISTNQIDLVDLCRLLRKNTRSNAVKEASRKVEQATREAIILAARGEARPRASGLALYFPNNDFEGQDWEDYVRARFGRTHAWGGFIKQFMGWSAKDQTAPKISALSLSQDTLSEGDTLEVTARIKGDDVDRIYFILSSPDEKDLLILAQIPIFADASGRVKKTWDGGWFTLGDGKNTVPCPVTEMSLVKEDGTRYFASVPADMKRKGDADDEWFSVSLYFDITQTRNGLNSTLVAIYEDSPGGKSEVRVRKGDKLRPLFPSINAEGEEEFIYFDEPDFTLTISKLSDVQAGYERIEAGDYRVGFLVRDLAGNTNRLYGDVEIK